MVVNFFTVHSLLKKKTGVQVHDLNIISSMIQLGINVRIFDYNPKSAYKNDDLLAYNDKNILDRIIFSRFPYRLGIHLPVNLVFGKDSPSKDELCIVDSFVPKGLSDHTICAILHDLMPMIYPQNYVSVKHYIQYLKQIQSVNYIWANSESTKKDYIKFFPKCKAALDVVPCCIKDVPLNDFNRDYERKWKDVSYVYYIGDMRKNKNLQTAVKAFLQYSKENETARFIVAGAKSGEYSTIKDIVDGDLKNGNRVKFLGYISDEEKYALIKNAKGLLFVSKYEGFGIPIVEAMAAGTTVITSNCSSMKEIAEGAAILVNPDDVCSIVDGLRRVFETNTSSLREIGLSRASNYNQRTQMKILKDKILR